MEEMICTGPAGTLACLWEKAAEEGPCPLVVCLAGGQEEGKRALAQLAARAKGAAVAVVPVEGAQEGDLADLLWSLRQREDVDECRVALLGTPAAADWVWRLGSRFPQWFAGVCAIGGHGDPYEARALKDVPLRAYPVKGEPLVLRDGRAAVDVERLAMGLRAAGGSQVEERSPAQGDPWQGALEDGAVEWLLSQDRRTQFQVMWLQPGVWRIDDWFTASCYLVEGREKALLIDTGMGEGDLAGLVSQLTDLPVEVAVTHPHLDHMHWIDKFPRVYLHKEDIAPLKEHPENYPSALSYPGASLPELMPIEEGSVIDLGGGVQVEVWELPGHTPHSVVFADPFHKCLFTGDAIGSGYIVLLITPEQQALELVAQYRQALERFAPHLPQARDYAWLGGHGIQENGGDGRHQQDYLAGTSQYFNPIRERVITDMMALCDGLLAGEIPCTPEKNYPEAHCELGWAGINFRYI